MRHGACEWSTRRTCWLGIVLGVAAARDASAETPLRELSLEELLEVDVVTPTAKPQPLRETPASVYVITADMIRMRGYRHLGELLEDIPGIQIERNSTVEWADQYSMRGLIGNERFIVMLDGIRVNSATNSPISIRHSYALNNIDRVEIVLGPGSAVYGADAFAGVIHMISRRGAQIDGGSVSTSFGRFRTTHDTFTLGGEEHGIEVALWGAFARSSEPSMPDFYRDDFAWYHDRYLRTGEVRTSPFDPPDSVVQTAIKPYTAPTMAGSLNGRLDVGNFRLSYSWLREQSSSSIAARPEFSLHVDEARWDRTIEALGGQHTFTGNAKKLVLTSLLSLQRYGVDPDTGYVNAFNGYIKRYKYAEDLVARVDERATYDVSESLTVSGGLSTTYVRATPKTFDLVRPFDPDAAAASQDLIYPGTDIVDASGRSLAEPVAIYEVFYRTFGGYTEVVGTPHERMTVTVGVRGDYDSRFGGSVNPRAGIVTAPSSTSRVKLLYGEAFLAPAPYLSYQHFGTFEPQVDSSGDVTGLRSDFLFLPNPDLGPEKLRTGEIAATKELGTMRFGANAYYTFVSDLIRSTQTEDETFRGWPVATASRLTNEGSAKIFGGSLTATGRFRLGPLSLQPALSHVFTQGSQAGTHIPVPRNAVRAILDMRWRDLSLSLRMHARERTRSRTQVDEAGVPLTSPGSAVVHLHASWSGLELFDSVRGRVFVTVTNLFDQRYYHFSDRSETFLATPQDPFRFLVGVGLER
jgi:outer membrane cobalamin receptor